VRGLARFGCFPLLARSGLLLVVVRQPTTLDVAEAIAAFLIQ
jgi:hypothetical protein